MALWSAGSQVGAKLLSPTATVADSMSGTEPENESFVALRNTAPAKVKQQKLESQFL